MASMQLLLCCATTLLIANALELTPQLLSTANNEPASGKAKIQYTPFPLLDDDIDVDAVELPLEVDQEQDENVVEQFPLPTRAQHSMPPAWLQFVEEPVQKPSKLANNKKVFKQQHKHPHGHGSGSGHGVCTIEITTKVPGICQPMSMGVGSACISGELMEVYSASHCSNF
ncbi:uncharacterized protein LOC6557902 [Drosophila grimshawi]|uniref:GH14608 n=1 Tax=Drosophila grimshawi TaxID=7222 RepID=B4IYC6_DROGR|nr:uncharacterized protein LOC6557902 [Drosophila grimshawi]EDV97599.1 GH14608 [Drosophila grimshawi]